MTPAMATKKSSLAVAEHTLEFLSSRLRHAGEVLRKDLPILKPSKLRAAARTLDRALSSFLAAEEAALLMPRVDCQSLCQDWLDAWSLKRDAMFSAVACVLPNPLMRVPPDMGHARPDAAGSRRSDTTAEDMGHRIED